MISVEDEQPRQEVLDQLAAWQTEVDNAGDFRARARAAHVLFERCRRKPALASVRETLKSMSGESERCWYCEDSQANQVEHVRPKSLYPGFAFAWLNLTFACSPCNLSKNDRFAIVLDGVLVPLVRRSDDDEPPDGRIGLLDLRREDPRELVTLDLRDSFHLSARERLDPLLTSRVEYTIEALRLNDDPHPARRHQAYLDYRAALREYLVWREQGRSRGQLDGLRARILRRDQLSVWREVQRQFQADTHFVELDHDFAELFEAVPEALDW